MFLDGLGQQINPASIPLDQEFRGIIDLDLDECNGGARVKPLQRVDERIILGLEVTVRCPAFRKKLPEHPLPVGRAADGCHHGEIFVLRPAQLAKVMPHEQTELVAASPSSSASSSSSRALRRRPLHQRPNRSQI